jgi:ribosomal protein L37AE/L43A
MMNSIEFSRQISKKVCPECGEPYEEQTESYLSECERCLSKKDE